MTKKIDKTEIAYNLAIEIQEAEEKRSEKSRELLKVRGEIQVLNEAIGRNTKKLKTMWLK